MATFVFFIKVSFLRITFSQIKIMESWKKWKFFASFSPAPIFLEIFPRDSSTRVKIIVTRSDRNFLAHWKVKLLESVVFICHKYYKIYFWAIFHFFFSYSHEHFPQVSETSYKEITFKERGKTPKKTERSLNLQCPRARRNKEGNLVNKKVKDSMKIKCWKRHSFEPIYQDFVNERMIYVESYANESYLLRWNKRSI